jgi:putative effector of murein hydrolase
MVETAGAFASLGMSLEGTLMAILLPFQAVLIQHEKR